MSTGGSIESVSLAGRTFPAAADADSNRKLGGFENEIQPNGDGTVRQIKTRVAWMLDGLTLDCDDVRNDHEFLQDLSDSNSPFPITITYASGVTYQGTGYISDELQYSSQSSTCALSLAGEGKLTPQ